MLCPFYVSIFLCNNCFDKRNKCILHLLIYNQICKSARSIQNDVIKCYKMMSSNVAKWCHHITSGVMTCQPVNFARFIRCRGLVRCAFLMIHCRSIFDRIRATLCSSEYLGLIHTKNNGHFDHLFPTTEILFLHNIVIFSDSESFYSN